MKSIRSVQSTFWKWQKQRPILQSRVPRRDGGFPCREIDTNSHKVEKKKNEYRFQTVLIQRNLKGIAKSNREPVYKLKQFYTLFIAACQKEGKPGYNRR